MKTLTFPQAALCFVLSASMFTSCKKEISESTTPGVTKEETYKPSLHSYSDTATGLFSHFPYKADRELHREPHNPSVYKTWYAMTAIGKNSEMPHTTTLCNQLFGDAPSGSFFLAASVNKFFVQKLGQAGLPAIPAKVSCITYDRAGNSIWFQLQPTSLKLASKNKLQFSGTSIVVGGTGIYKGATGSVATRGYFNLLDEEDAVIGNRGTILY